MASLDPTTRSRFFSDLRSAEDEVRQGVVPSRAAASIGHWKLWATFCSEIGLDPTLPQCEDPVPFLQVFAYRYRHGTLAPRKKPVRSRTVEGALRSIGQTFATVGAPDPRLTSHGTVDFRIRRQLACYSKKDPPPDRVKPIPVPIILHILMTAVAGQQVRSLAIADMICLAFFFLLRPGEYTGSPSDTKPFRLCDVTFKIGAQKLDLNHCSDIDLLSATFVQFEFTDQKNAVRGEVIGLGRSGHPHFCPVLSSARRAIHIRRSDQPLSTPLATYLAGTTTKHVTPADITARLRLAVTLRGPTYGFLPKDISARSLRASGAMALLCAQVDTDVIRLIGRWRSDEMLRYLHVQAEPVMRNFSSRMLAHGSFTLHPNSEVPMY